MPKAIVDSINNISLNYQCLGEGEDLVLIHGLGANLAFWYPGIAAVLSRHYRVIIYDLRGHGNSSMPSFGYTVAAMTADLQELLIHLKVASAHIVGHSFGARIACQYAIAHPSQVNSLTIADTQFYCLQPRMQLRDWFYWQTWKDKLIEQGASLPSDDEFISFHLLTKLNQISSESVDNDEKLARKPSLKNRVLGRRSQEKWQNLIDNTTATKEFDEDSIVATDFVTISMPTLIVYGEYSPCLPTYWKVKELLPNCQSKIMPKVGHFHPAVQPKRFVYILWKFLQQKSKNAEELFAFSSTEEW
ncbi:MAG: alpha/beta hydrolase [Chroococcus sp. CMT-3BRIN-NPC107]|jgi:pimeloyl-ACP methyl ester carboxylesterase|nr:alpha/beta hydrolase [Chroococcus sp. CMT-3BRIN-NPC107]